MSLHPAHHDALLELGNIGISRAARQLAALLGEPIHIEVPEVELLPLSEASQRLGLGSGEIACVYQRMSGDLWGRVALLLPTRDSSLLLHGLIGPQAPLQGLDLRAFEHEALAEIGNILISSCVSAMADMLGLRIDLSQPRYTEASLMALYSDETAATTEAAEAAEATNLAEQTAMVVHARMRAHQREQEAAILLLLSTSAADRVMQAVQAMILVMD